MRATHATAITALVALTGLAAVLTLPTTPALAVLAAEPAPAAGAQKSAVEQLGCSDVAQDAGYTLVPGGDTGTGTKHYFSWLFASRHAPDEDPLVIFLSGGPGCSSDLALFLEVGPCRLDAASGEPRDHPEGWNARANLLLVDQPAPTGLTWADEPVQDEDHDERQIAADFLTFLTAWLDARPAFRTRPIALFAESYGGHYGLSIGHAIQIHNRQALSADARIPLTHIGIGNGLVQPAVQYASYPQMAFENTYGIQAVSEPQFEHMVAALPACLALIDECQTDPSACAPAFFNCSQSQLAPYAASGRSVYDVRVKCGEQPDAAACMDFSLEQRFFERADVRAALGVPDELVWEGCNFETYFNFLGDWMRDQAWKLTELLDDPDDGVRVLVYSGDADFIVNWYGGLAWTRALSWTGQADFNAAPMREWLVDGEPAGQLQTAGALSFLRVYGASHMVPASVPRAALAMLEEFLEGAW